MKVTKDLDLFDYGRYFYDKWYSYYFKDIECFLEGCYSSIEEDTLINILRSKEELNYILRFHPDIAEYCMSKDVEYEGFPEILFEDFCEYIYKHYNNFKSNIDFTSIYGSIVDCVFIDTETNTFCCYFLDEELDLKLEEKEEGYIGFVDGKYEIEKLIKGIIQDKVDEIY